MTFTPDPEKISHYPTPRRPYVQFTMNERKFHARVNGWQGEMIMVSYPPTLISKYTHGQRTTVWMHKSEAVRIRREDSVWADLEDDWPWHEAQDAKISFRPDPWIIYSQQFPDAES
ncbi:MAG: hypothetical protein WBX27_14625 [Specibacter sp.]